MYMDTLGVLDLHLLKKNWFLEKESNVRRRLRLHLWRDSFPPCFIFEIYLKIFRIVSYNQNLLSNPSLQTRNLILSVSRLIGRFSEHFFTTYSKDIFRKGENQNEFLKEPDICSST